MTDLQGTDSIQGYHILIIDDDETTHEVLSEYFGLSGYGVIGAYDGSQGLQMIEIYNPDLVLLDVDMPIMDGFKTMEAIGDNPEMRKIPVIFISTLNRDNLKIKALELGADDYIIKPFNKSELLARVRAALRRSERFRRSESSMKGNLGDVTLAELLQTMELGRKTGHISLLDMDADIYLEKGKIVSARIGIFESMGAVQRIMLLERGAFTTSFEPFPESLKDEVIPVQRALMDTARVTDEIRRKLAKITDEKNPLVEIRESTTNQKLAAFSRISPITFNDLIVRMDGGLEENMQLIIDAYQDGTLELVS
jgi:DNA-binding response OmpR family regulator